ncbi:hypothetical protein J4481_01360 [Candidatus Pacearchaeota archaeon]|nr:hypothetical protein [Candidatus Pacearchaeota archaeon]
MSNEFVKLNERKNWEEVMQMDANGVTSNFYLYFSPSWIGDIYRKMPIFNRLNLAKPDLVKVCLHSGKDYSQKLKTRVDHYQTIFPAYEFMEKNVLLSDKDVVNEEGNVDRDYLFR